jgi:hypothetical protein
MATPHWPTRHSDFLGSLALYVEHQLQDLDLGQSIWGIRPQMPSAMWMNWSMLTS